MRRNTSQLQNYSANKLNAVSGSGEFDSYNNNVI